MKNAITARFLHDIGAGVCLMLSKDFVEDSTVLQKKRKLWAKEGEGVGGKIDMHLTVVKELKLDLTVSGMFLLIFLMILIMLLLILTWVD